jgi:hypothetical protein
MNHLGGARAADAFTRPTEPPRTLYADHDEKRKACGGHEAAPRIFLEGTPAEVPEASRERGPKQRGDRSCEQEASSSHSRETGSKRHGSPAAGDEPGDDDQIRAPALEDASRPFEPLEPGSWTEEPTDGRIAGRPPEDVRAVVADKRTGGRGRHAATDV